METGNTPLIEIDGIFAKLECDNPTGSIKDRMAEYIIEESEKRGLLKEGMTIVEATSGNTGISLSFFGRKYGHPVVIVMPDNMTQERKDKIRSFGAELILCNGSDFSEVIRIRDRLVLEKGYFNMDQFSNPLNVECHYRTTASEILKQMPAGKNIDIFVAGTGTGGTLIGVGKRLREEFPDIKIAAVEPTESAVMSGGKPGAHGIPGIGDGFLPDIMTDGTGRLSSFIDIVETCPTGEARKAAQYLSDAKGACVGISSGANFLAAKRLAKKYDTVITVFPDEFSRYKSTGLKRIGGAYPCKFLDECKCLYKNECRARFP